MIKHYFVLDSNYRIIYHTFGKKRGNTRAFNVSMQSIDYTLIGPIHTQDSKASGHNYGVTYSTGFASNEVILLITNLAAKMQTIVVKPSDIQQWNKYVEEYNSNIIISN